MNLQKLLYFSLQFLQLDIPSEELLDALMEAGKYLLLNFYDKQIKNPLKIYELYYFFENLRWSIIFQLKEGYSVKQTINQLKDGYNKYIGASQNWLIHFCWINLISGLMSYRPIIYRAEVEQMLNQKHHISWNQLIVSNQIVVMPYDKTKGKVKYSGRGTFIIKEFSNLKLFQEYLLDEQVDSIKLLSQYLNFDFSSQQQSQIKLQDLTISLFTNIDDLEILSQLLIALQNCHLTIKENFNQIDNQTSKDEVISMQNKTEIKIYKQDIQYLINQQKDSFLQLLYIFYEIDIIRIKETEIINNMDLILRSNEKNLGLLKDKTYIEQMPNLNEIRVEAQNRFIKYLQQLPNLLFQYTQIVISYEEIIQDESNLKVVSTTYLKQTLIKQQQELEIFMQAINDFLINFICKIKKIKNNVIQINSQISLSIAQEQISISKDLTFLAIQNSHNVELFEEFCNPSSIFDSKIFGINKNFEYKGIFFLNNKLVINVENFNSSFLQFWNTKYLTLKFEQLFKVKFNYFNFFKDENLMFTIGKFVSIWEKSEVYYEEKKSLNSFNKQKWKKIEYLEKKDYMLIFDGESVYLFKNYLDSDQSSHEIEQKKIYSSPLIQAVSFSKNGKLLAFGLKNGFKIMLLDQYLKLNQDSQYINDFSISNDSSLLVLATNSGIRLKNQETNKEIFYTLDQQYLLIRFIEQSKKFVAITQSFLYIYKLDDINNPIIFYHLILCGNKIQAIYNLEQSNSMMILYDKFITIHSISKDCLILSNSNYVGIGIDNDIRFIPLCNSIKMHNIYIMLFFSLNCSELLIIGLNYKEMVQSAKINLINLEIEIKSSEINFGFINFIYSNQKQDKLLLVYYDHQNQQRKLDLIDFESFKIIQCLEQSNDDESSFCNYAIFIEDNSYFITQYQDQTIKLWDSKSYKLLSKFKSDITNSDLISISTKEILAQSSYKIIKQSEMDGHSDSINLISISPDGLQLVSGSQTQIIRWELTKLKKIDVLIKGQNLHSLFCFSEDTNYFAAVDQDPCLIKIWKLNTLYLIENFMTISYFTKPIHLKFKIADNHLISCYQIKSQQYHIAWDLSKPEKYSIQRNTCYIDIPKPAMQFLSDNNLMVQIQPLKIFRLFDYESQEYFQFDLSQSKSDAKLIAITHDNFKLAVQIESELILWSVTKKQFEHRFENNIGCPQNLVFSGDNKVLFSNYNVTIRCLDVTDQYKIIKEFKLYKPDEIDEQQFDQVQCFPVKNDDFLIVYSFIEPLKKIVILATYVSDYEQFQLLLETKTSRDFFNCAYCDKRQILAIQNNFYFSLFDMKSKKQIAILEPNQFTNFNPNLLSFSKDGNYQYPSVMI